MIAIIKHPSIFKSLVNICCIFVNKDLLRWLNVIKVDVSLENTYRDIIASDFHNPSKADRQ